MSELWEFGGHRDRDEPGRRPEFIVVRGEFIGTRPDHPYGPALPRLIKSRGLQLRLLLLLLFDAQCRAEPGERVRNVRTIVGPAGENYRTWRELVLSETSPTRGTGRTAQDLRVRQITEALRALEGQHLVSIPRHPGGRRDYDAFELLSEASTADEHPPYLVPEAGIRIPRQFFTELWVFALTDTELATYLLLSFLRWRFPSRHLEQGVFVTAETREKVFRIARATWRATDLLHRYRLIDRMPDPRRQYRTGKVGDPAKRWANREVAPARFKINNDALSRPALDVIDQVLGAPTAQDVFRRETGMDMPGLTFDSTLPG
ncbi:hypothetical protein [Nocardia sp. NRRL S-836]|uniref:hypothetical protein n=1 Tax=Nocardia sp. NRRL S-836 TaxID=1519492 RepID=UPI0012F7E457|nr:hypothetical protein [Nocardia sp. NRRL S-836]